MLSSICDKWGEGFLVTGADLLIESLKAQGVRAVFGMPGTQNVPMYDSLLTCGGDIKHYLVRHEWSATKMADGFARATGDVGVAFTVPGPGASNASTGIVQAFTDCVPVLLITGQAAMPLLERSTAKLFHGLDQREFFKPITKWVGRAETADDVARVVERAFRLMRSGRPAPVVLEIPMDVMMTKTNSSIPPFVEKERLAPSPDDIKQVASALAGVKRPVILAGRAVVTAGACDELRLLAERLNVPVATTRAAKGLLPEDHPLAVSHMVGFMARKVVDEADCTLAVGVRFTQLDTMSWNANYPRPTIQLDPDSDEIGSEYPCDVSVVGDLKLVLQGLLDECDVDGGNGWDTVLSNIRAENTTRPVPMLLPALRDVLNRDAIVSVDVNSLGYRTFAEFPVYDPHNFLYPCHAVSLGHSLPAALGAKAAFPDRQVVCFIGDGGFGFGGMEMATAAQYGLNVVFVVVNDGALTAIKGVQQEMCDGRVIDTELTNPDFVRFAESFGVAGRRVSTGAGAFKDALQDALAADGPVLLEVPMHGCQEELISGIPWMQPEAGLVTK